VEINTPTPLSKFFKEKCGKELPEAEVLDYKKKLIQFFLLLVEIDQKGNKDLCKQK
jgi:hypothetical protein